MSDDQTKPQLLLRYRFDSRAQAADHLHEQDYRLLVFYPNPTLKPALGTSAALDLTFDDTDQSRVLTGEVVSVSPGGFYVRSARGGLAREIREGLVQRSHRRLGANLTVEVQRGSAVERAPASLTDVSLGGAQLSGIEGLQNRERVRLRLLTALDRVPAQLGFSTVIWNGTGSTGLKFDRADPATRAAVAALNGKLLEDWSRAASLKHSSHCCKDGVPIDPPLPEPRLLAG